MKQWIEAVPGGHKARIRYPDGKTRSKTFPSVREARAWLRRTLTEVDAGTYVPEANGKVLFADWAAQFVTMSVDLAPGIINRRASDLKNWVLPEFGHRALSSITQPQVRAWVAAMTKAGCNAGSVKLRYETLSTILRAAVDADSSVVRPASGSDSPATSAARCGCSRSRRSRACRTRSIPATGPWCFSPAPEACASASWAPSGESASTSSDGWWKSPRT